MIFELQSNLTTFTLVPHAIAELSRITPYVASFISFISFISSFLPFIFFIFVFILSLFIYS